MTRFFRRRESDRGSSRGVPDSGYGLESLDPARRDPGYWTGFHLQVMRRAAHELSRRRARAEVTVLELAQSWTRILVPAAALAAAVGAVILSQEPSERSWMADGPEEVLTQELEDPTLPDFMALEGAEDGAFLLAGGTY